MKKTPSLFHSLVLATLLALGLVTVWTGGSLVVMQVFGPSPRRIDRYESLVVTPEGTPIVQITEHRFHDPYAGSVTKYRDLLGQPLSFPDKQAWLQPALLNPSRPEGPWSVMHSPWRERLIPLEGTHTIWRFLVADELGGSSYFVAYDRESKTRLGFLGTQGFRSETLTPEERIPFSVHFSSIYQRVTALNDPRSSPIGFRGASVPELDNATWSLLVVGDDHKLYRFDLFNRTAEVVLEHPSIMAISDSRLVDNQQKALSQRVVLRTADEILVLDENLKVAKRWPIPAQLRNQSFVFAENTSRGAIVYTFRRTDGQGRTTQGYDIFRFDPSGEIHGPESIELDRGYTGINATGNDGSLIFPIPLAIDAALIIAWAMSGTEAREAVSFVDALRTSGIVALNVISLILAVFVLGRQRRFATPKLHQIVWPLYVFLFGIPGWVGYRYCRMWPVLERCSACGKQAPQDRTFCAHCRAEFPLPTMKGTEIIV